MQNAHHSAPAAPVQAKRLDEAQWRERREAHLQAVGPYTRGWRKRRCDGGRHPIQDFLFQYYAFGSSRLEGWHPPLGTELEDAPAIRSYVGTFSFYEAHADHFRLKAPDAKCLERARHLLALQGAILARPPAFGCAGLHEWAMLYRTDRPRHEQLPLRVDEDTIAKVCEELPIVCTHFDAFRFFTPAAVPLNRQQLKPEQRVQHEQSGCLHANMDLYKAAFLLWPWSGADLVRDCFELAVAIREVDMRASPYDVSSLGGEAIPVETVEGRETYRRLQQDFAERARPLRERVVEAARAILASHSMPSSCSSERSSS